MNERAVRPTPDNPLPGTVSRHRSWDPDAADPYHPGRSTGQQDSLLSDLAGTFVGMFAGLLLGSRGGA